MNKYLHTNRTKIVATIGPATAEHSKLLSIIKAGVNVVRLNFSHGTHEDHRKVIELVRKINADHNTHIGILLDLQGPKLRVGEMKDGAIKLKSGATVLVTAEKIEGTVEKFSLSHENLARDVKPGERILLDDGKIELKALEAVDRRTINCKVVHGGVLSSRKGFNLPNTNLSIPSLTEKDIEDLDFGLQHDVDWIGLSFVRKPEDILELKNIIARKKKYTRVVAKIEKPEAVKAFDKILEVTDAVMVARGDLGVEMPMESVPLIQKEIVGKCIKASKPVIIATQMMESMIQSPTPTRAETNDVANAVLDGADAVMLSAETSVGLYPVETVQAMLRIITNVESTPLVYFRDKVPSDKSQHFVTDVICHTAARMSMNIRQVKAIVGMTRSGYSAFQLSSHRPKSSICIFTNNEPLLNMLSLVWGVHGFFYDKFVSTDQTFNDVMDILKTEKIVKKGDFIIHTASMPIMEKARTNAVKISEVK